MGADYKHFYEAVGYTTPGGQTTNTPVTYLPFSVSYSATLPDEWGGINQFTGGLNMSFRGVVSDESEFELKRYMASANYLYVTAGVQRTQKLPAGLGLSVKLDGQASDQPLIDNEQYIAGGMQSVRGYKESEAAGDNAIHGMFEISFPDPFGKSSIGKWLQLSPYIFYDMARLVIQDPLPGQKSSIRLEGTGAGMRGLATKNLEYEVDWAMALSATDQTAKHDQRINFSLRAVF